MSCSPNVERLSHVGPVTALAFTPSNSHILYGSGPSLCCHSAADGKSVSRRNIFKRNRIHGINIETLPDEILALLWGAESFAFISLDDVLNPSKNVGDLEIIAPDWILDVRLIDSATAGLVTANNAFFTYATKTRAFLRCYILEEQSLLYAAQICLAEEHDILIASGTVFNEIQLWRPLANSTSRTSSSTATVPIQARLKGHEGCIFSLRFNDAGTILASCSDDRTIRIWDLKEGTSLATGFAHVARVWDVRFIPRSSCLDENYYLLSNSEDTSALLWQFSPAKRKLVVCERYHGHGGKHVWSQAISNDGKLAVTGGNDGAVNIWDIGGWWNRVRQDESDIFWVDKSPRIIRDGKERLDTIKGYRCVDDDRLLMTTQSGCVYVYSLSKKQWTLLVQEEQFSKYSTVGLLDGMEGWVCIGYSRGLAMIFHLDNYYANFKWEVCEGLIVTFYTTVSQRHNRLYILSQGVYPQVSLSVIAKDSNKFSLESNQSFDLPSGFEVTAFLSDTDRGVFILGSRQGAIACYELSSAKLIGVWRRIHDQESVRSIQLNDSNRDSSTCTEILTTGRNGAYRILRISFPGQFIGFLPVDVITGSLEGVTLQDVHRCHLNRGWLEGSALVNSNLLLWGFHERTFSFWNETTGELIFEHDSGGANRIWDFYLPSNSISMHVDDVARRAWLVYTSKSELHFRRSRPRLLQKAVKKGNHGREVRCMALRPSDSDPILLASGSEDTYINFTEVRNGELEFVHRKKQYNTGIQALTFSHDGKVMFSSAGQKEVAVSHLRVSGQDFISVEFGGYSNSGKMDMTKARREDDEGGDLRIMAIDARHEKVGEVNGYLIAVVLSDSAVKLYWFNPITSDCTLVISGKYATCCLLCCKFIPGHDILAVTATDGHVAFFSVQDVSKNTFHGDWNFVSRFQIHQSGIKCLEVAPVSESVTYLVTGGDDNAVHLSEVAFDDGISCRILASALDRHTSTVTGVLHLGNLRFLSIGIDQKIMAWEFDGVKLTCVYQAYTFVPDVCGVIDIGVHRGKKRFVIFGTGMELIAWEDSEKIITS